ncbi:MAG TPA: bifunctional DNA-formamidopyrimidine glycosylase/DNA-(apurinic or apyrimidinic site) lyase [Candidatus Thermoplasmatota archaeon]|nr:bifunctional DNA-formamidopyrimidine glycosylase/DNA-(apurinic or apyrimidinic site) lyase [Candidatus Thermoplasmatota archaeon]
MPELPEVETIRRGLARELKGRQIEGVDWRPTKLRGGKSPLPLERLGGQRVTALRRHGKFLLWDLSGGGTFLAHLGMTGKFLFAEPGEQQRPHTHLVLSLDDERELRYSDPRRFGLLKLFPKGAGIPDLAHYGIDALDPAFTPKALGTMLASSSAPLKAFLLDQTWIAGVGNIYACEALWRAGLSPRRKARTTQKAKVAPLHKGILGALNDSLAAGGSSFNDYVDAIGNEGRFMMEVAVFQREGEDCPRCGAAIRRIVQSGRSTFYCPACQK